MSKALYRVNEAEWISMFVPQLATLACEYDLNTRDDDEYEQCLLLHGMTAKLN